MKAAEANMKLKHHEELDSLRKQLQDLKVSLNVQTGSQHTMNVSTGTVPKAKSHQNDTSSNNTQKQTLNPNANVFSNSTAFHTSQGQIVYSSIQNP